MSNTWRTAALNLLFDVVLAVIVVVLPAISGAETNWALVLGSAAKTAAATALVGAKNWIEARRGQPPTS